MYEKNAWEVLNGAIKQERRNGNYKDWKGIIIILHLENKNFKVLLELINTARSQAIISMYKV